MIYYLVVFLSDGQTIRDINSYDSEESREEALKYYKTYFNSEGFLYYLHEEIR